MIATRLLARLAGALTVAAATVAVPVLAAAPAQAAGCTTSTGVTVVVDFNSTGGGVQSVCVRDGGGSRAATLFSAAGFQQTYASREPGFVCRVDGKPASDPCVNASPASAYWSLWWSNGTSGKWIYSNLGVQSLTVPAGGTVAWSFDDVAGDAPPSATPRRSAPSGEADGGSDGGSDGSDGSDGSGGSGGSGGDDGGSGATPTDPPSATPSDEPSGDDSAGAGQGREDGKSDGGRDDKGGDQGDKDAKKGAGQGRHGGTSGDRDDADPDSVSITEADTEPTAAEPADGGLPAWVPPVVVLGLLGAGGAAALARRRATR